MAIKEIKSLNNGLGEYVREFICDLASDLADMPKAINNVAIGSTVLCLENKTKYILSVGDIWKQFETPKADLVGGKVPTEQLPSYVDDVLEFNTLADFPATGESGKIYVVKDTNKIYRWGGSEYVPIGNDLALGETSSTAYRGDKGKIAYDHSQEQGNAHNLSPDEISYDGTISGLSSTNVKTAIDELASEKVDKTYVDTQDALKADKTYVDTELSLKENIADNNQKLALKANKSYVDNELALKADKTYVDAQDALKVDKNANITGATKTKITYDSKGLVTAGADLVESDIPALSPSKITQDTSNRFVSDTEKTTWNNKENKSEKGVANGYASLDGEAKVPSSQLPIGVPYITTEPTSANTNGNLIMVVLTSEPTTKYAGYFYIITEE